jgi:putative DNA primase/helicase
MERRYGPGFEVGGASPEHLDPPSNQPNCIPLISREGPDARSRTPARRPSWVLPDSGCREMTTAAEIAYQLDLRETGKGGYTGRCPSCQYETGFSVIDKNGRTLVHCHAGGCTQQEVIQALHEYGLWGDEASKSVELPVEHSASSGKAHNADAAREMWQRSEPAAGTVVETYLRARGYLGAIPISLRYVTGKHPADKEFHAVMLAGALLFAESLKLVGVHRTFLQMDGSGKISFEPAKMTLGALQGAGVPLSMPRSKVAVSEGIETGLSVQQATGIPTIAALSAAGMQSLVLPPYVEDIFIAADADEVGMKAAQIAARRWHAEGRRVRIVKPPAGSDFNDLGRSAR